MVPCSASHDNVDINYLVVMFPTTVEAPRVSFHTASVHKMSSRCGKVSQFSANVVFFKIKQKMWDVLVKIWFAGKKAKCGISRTIAGRFTPMKRNVSNDLPEEGPLVRHW